MRRGPLDQDDGIAGVDKAVEDPHQEADVGKMEPGGRLVQHVDAARLVQLRRELQPPVVRDGLGATRTDINAGDVVSTGPEIWTGTFNVHGPSTPRASYRREDFWPGERHQLDAIGFRWNIARWERPRAMQGWFVKGG